MRSIPTTRPRISPGLCGRLLARAGKLGFAREVLLLVAAYFTYMFVKRVIVPGAEEIGVSNAVDIISLEKSIGIFWEADLQGAASQAGEGVLLLFNYLYILTFFPVLLTSAVILYFLDRERYVFYRNMILLTFVVALTFFAVFPLSPPRFMDIKGVVDSIDVYGPAWYASRDLAAYYNGHAAMPSLHFAWSVLFGFLFCGSKPVILKVIGVLYPTVTFFSIVITGNHYVLDAVGGGLVILLVYLIYQEVIGGILSRR